MATCYILYKNPYVKECHLIFPPETRAAISKRASSDTFALLPKTTPVNRGVALSLLLCTSRLVFWQLKIKANHLLYIANLN